MIRGNPLDPFEMAIIALQLDQRGMGSIDGDENEYRC